MTVCLSAKVHDMNYVHSVASDGQVLSAILNRFVLPRFWANQSNEIYSTTCFVFCHYFVNGYHRVNANFIRVVFLVIFCFLSYLVPVCAITRVSCRKWINTNWTESSLRGTLLWLRSLIVKQMSVCSDINWGSSTQAHVYRNALIHSQKLVTVVEHVKNYRSAHNIKLYNFMAQIINNHLC